MLTSIGLARRAARPALTRALSTPTFAELEYAMWQKGAKSYSNTFAMVTYQAADALLDGASVPRARAKTVEKVYSTAPATFPNFNKAAVPSPKVPLSEEVLASQPKPTPFRVLDVATGPGLLAAAAAERGATEVVGVDVSEAMIESAQPVADAHPGVVSFVKADAEKLPMPDALSLIHI